MKAHLLGCICASALFLIYGRPYAEPSLAESQTFFERGINLSGGELNPQRKPATYGKDYIYPRLSELDYFAGKGFAVVRLLYRWERLQPTLFGNLDKAELRRIKRVVLAAHARNMRVILTPANFGRYFINGEQVLIGTTRVPIESFADFSHKVAAAFAGDPAVYALSLMNEPHDSNGLWKQAGAWRCGASSKAQSCPWFGPSGGRPGPHHGYCPRRVSDRRSWRTASVP